jgi:predicted aconitase with swiveling domain
MGRVSFKCRPVTRGLAEGEALVTRQPISFWGGLDPAAGVIIDKRHELYGKSVAGKVLIFPYAKGSVSATTVLLEAVRCNSAPVAIVSIEIDPVVAVAAFLAEKLYGKMIPIVDKPEINPLEAIKSGDLVRVDAVNGVVEVLRSQS